MGILLIFLLIVCASSINEIDYFIYDIPYGKRYEIDTTRFPSAIIPKSFLYFKIKVENINEINFQVRLLKSDNINFKVMFSSFDQYPSDSAVYQGNENIELEQSSVSIEYNYIIYTFNAPSLKKTRKI